MAKNLKIDQSFDSTYAPLLTECRDAIDRVETATDFADKDILLDLVDRLPAIKQQEREALAECKSVLYGDDTESYGEKVARIFTAWEEGEKEVSSPVLCLSAIDYFDIPKNSSEARALLMAALLAELPNDLQYHGNIHYRKVLFHTIRLAALHNRLFSNGERHIEPSDLALLLIAACIHDLGHEGGDNFRDGVYTPGYMEQKAMEITRPFLEEAGLTADQIADIDTMVFSTDITLYAGDNSPCARLKKIYKNVFWDSDEDVSLMMMGRMGRYADNPNLVHMAMILHEADVGSSAGLSYEQTVKETISIMEERDLKTAGPATVLAFLREQLGQTMFTEAAKQLFGSVMQDVIKRAEEDVRNGRKTFYEDGP